MDPIEAAEELARRIARLRSFGEREEPNGRETAFASGFIVDMIEAGWHKPPTTDGKESPVDDFYKEDEGLEAIKKAWDEAGEVFVTIRPAAPPKA